MADRASSKALMKEVRAQNAPQNQRPLSGAGVRVAVIRQVKKYDRPALTGQQASTLLEREKTSLAADGDGPVGMKNVPY